MVVRKVRISADSDRCHHYDPHLYYWRPENVLTITKTNFTNVIWEIFSDKFIAATSFTYDLQVEVVGPNFTDDPVKFGTPSPIVVPLPTGRVKYISPLILPLPPIPPDKIDTINRFIRAG